MLVMAAAVGAAGCGSDDEAWADQANALCEDLERDVRDIAPLREIEHPEEFAPYVSLVAAAARDWLTRMQALEPPEDDEERVAEMLRLYDEGIDKTEQAATALGDGDESAYEQVLREGNSVLVKADEIAVDLGADSCAYPLSG
jgi:hypothetical protein